MSTREILPEGTVLDGKYRILRLIGAGGFGMTYEAHDIGLGQSVAVKEYYPAQFGMRDGTFTVRPTSPKDQDLFDRLKESFLREARTLAALRHPSIVRVISVFEGHGTAYMVMEFERGQSLKGWLDGLGHAPTQDALDRIVMPLLDALDVMHAASFLHRDIAPDNIIVRADGSPVLLDFGAARRVMAELSGALTGIVKQGYSPQEQYANDPRAQGPWSDIYALGATLYRCVTGETPAEATIRMLDDPVRPSTEAAAGRGYRAGFLAAIDRAMSLRPKDQPQSIGAFRTLLAAAEPAKMQASEAVSRQQVLPGAGGWSRISPPPKAHVSDRYASTGRGWRIGIGTLAAVAVAGVLMAMIGYAGRRSDEVRLAEDAQRKSEPNRAEQREAEGAKLKAEVQARLEAERRKAEAARREAEAAKLAGPTQGSLTAFGERRKAEAEAAQRKAGVALAAADSTAALLDNALGACRFCDDVKKLVSDAEFAELQSIPDVIGRTWADVRNRKGPREDAVARRILEQLAQAEIGSDPLAVIKTGNVKCTTYDFGFLDNAAERVGTHQCVVRQVLISGELNSMTIEKTTGDGFHASFKGYRSRAMMWIGRTFLKGHKETRYNQAVPKNAENDNYGNKIGLLIAIGGKPALVTVNQNGFTGPDPTFFQVTVLE